MSILEYTEAHIQDVEISFMYQLVKTVSDRFNLQI